jgi:peptide chain release factor 2
LQELALQAENPAVWNDAEKLQKLNREKSGLEKAISEFESFDQKLSDAVVLMEMSIDANDESSFDEVKAEAEILQKLGSQLEIKRVLNGEMDANSSFLSINSGAGGTESCDWAEMLMRMYMRYADQHGYRCEVLDISEGEGAGIKSVTMVIEGPYAYGYLKAESGVHRLVRISPFDSNARRHTSFASVFAWPEVDDDIKIEVNPADVDMETYRASGAGGQYVNRTDSAVRLRHRPSGIVVACQTERSQLQNRARAMKMLKAALFEKEMEIRNKAKQEMEAGKKSVEWGSQIRSYVMHPYQMVKDHRTAHETSQVQSVMDGDLEGFIMAYLKAQVTGFVGDQGSNQGADV